MNGKAKIVVAILGVGLYAAIIKVVANKITEVKLENLNKSIAMDIENGKWD